MNLLKNIIGEKEEMSKECVILGAGNSISEGISKGLWAKIKGKEIWSLNSAFKTMPYLPSKELWVDAAFFTHEVGNLQKLWSQGVELIAKEHKKYKPFRDRIKQYTICRDLEFYGKELMKNINLIFTGGHGFVGIFALSLACKMEYNIIYLLGYDWGTINMDHHKTHYYQDDIKRLNIHSAGAGQPEIYLGPEGKRFLKEFKVYKIEKSKIYNVSLISNITEFEKISWEVFFEKIKE